MFSMTFFSIDWLLYFLGADREFASFSLVMEGAPIQIQTIEAFWKCKKYTF